MANEQHKKKLTFKIAHRLPKIPTCASYLWAGTSVSLVWKSVNNYKSFFYVFVRFENAILIKTGVWWAKNYEKKKKMTGGKADLNQYLYISRINTTVYVQC